VNEDLLRLPGDLPVPVDDGATDHLLDLELPALALPATDGGPGDGGVCLADLDRTVVFAYPRSGVPGKSAGPQWNEIPGARGCTPQSCGFRDLKQEFGALGVHVLGLSTQTTAFQLEFARRMRLPFPLLSDAELRATRALRLPTFTYEIGPLGGGGPDTLLRRLALYVEEGVVRKVWYPVFPPDENAGTVLRWLAERDGRAG